MVTVERQLAEHKQQVRNGKSEDLLVTLALFAVSMYTGMYSVNIVQIS